MENEKTLWQTIKGTVQGINNEGSAKRATSFYFVAVIITGLVAVYIYGLIIAVNSLSPTEVHKKLVSFYPEILWSAFIVVLTLMGYATLELITSIVKKVTGDNTSNKETDL